MSSWSFFLFRCLDAALQSSFFKKERGSNFRWSPSTVGALPGMCPNRSCGRDPQGNPRGIAPREETHVLGALALMADVETLALFLPRGTQANDQIDDLVEDRRPDTGPHQL